MNKKHGSQIGGDQIITRISLIERYSRHNEDSDWRFRAFLKADSSRSNEQVDAIVREETDRVWSRIDCTTCANCCRKLQIVVDNADINRLAARLGMPVAEFEKRYVARDKELGGRSFASSPCAFLGEDNRCAVYEDRPQACRDYPYLHEPEFRRRSINMVVNTAVCPIVFNVWRALKQRLWKRAR